ncbi:penicillin-binding protein 1C [Microvirga sp. W0021]|uniref:peptidoglycan glycosyltransferase n=1 Tax=Hohaiivirga grylli TaxID=3133970 RepID=A0ABV0BGM6_9HYPH
MIYKLSLGELDLSASKQNSTVVIDRNGQLLRPFTTSAGRWRLPVSMKDVDERYLMMLKAYEDRRFEQHHGVDFRSLARAGLQLLSNQKVISGGSTLTMQVARLLEPREQRTLGAKFQQLVRAFELERRFSKTEILELYLMMAPFGGNLEGIRAASFAYFGKEPQRLSYGEAALLVALPQSPETRRPDRYPNTALKARNRVLDKVVEAGIISEAEGERAKLEPIPNARFAFPNHAAHTAETLVAAKPKASIIRLSINKSLQQSLETLARDALLTIDPKANIAIFVLDNKSGEVLASVGSSDYMSSERSGAIDLTQAVRSPGSALKPFIYALAFENGIAHPETFLDDSPSRFGDYRPENFDLGYQGNVTARKALQLSLNIPSVELLSEVGAARFIQRLRQAGADIALPQESAPGLAVGLGGLGISLVDITRLYSGLARYGVMPELVWEADATSHAPIAESIITTDVAAWYVFDILQGAPPPENALAGRIAFKTGTSYGYRDAWAIGYDQRITIGVWVGRADNTPVAGLVGRQIAAPVLFDAFAHYGGEMQPLQRPKFALIATSSTLPPPLRHLRKDIPKTLDAALKPSLKIAYPLDGARVDLGYSGSQTDHTDLAMKVLGGKPPFIWIANGVPIGEADIRRQAFWKPDGAGFARISVMDADGQVDSVTVRIE